MPSCSRSGTDFSSTIGQSVPIRTWSAPRMSTAALSRPIQTHRVDIDMAAGESGRVASDTLTIAEAASKQHASKRERRDNQLKFRDIVECAALVPLSTSGRH